MRVVQPLRTGNVQEVRLTGPHNEGKAVTHLNAEVKKSCFFCTPFERPLCNECVEKGRTKVCPECGSYVLGTRTVCKKCGHAF